MCSGMSLANTRLLVRRSRRRGGASLVCDFVRNVRRRARTLPLLRRRRSVRAGSAPQRREYRCRHAFGLARSSGMRPLRSGVAKEPGRL